MIDVFKERKTNETIVSIQIKPDGFYKNSKINTSLNFLDHMLYQVCYRSNLEINIEAKSLDKDGHHIVEDVAIVFGNAILTGLGDKLGIRRYGSCILPMDDALALVAIDFSSRPYFKIDANISQQRVSDFDTILLPHFFQSFANSSQSTLHIRLFDGYDPHHIIECIFKAFGEALKIAISLDNDKKNEIPSTKGIL